MKNQSEQFHEQDVVQIDPEGCITEDSEDSGEEGEIRPTVKSKVVASNNNASVSMISERNLVESNHDDTNQENYAVPYRMTDQIDDRIWQEIIGGTVKKTMRQLMN